MMQKPVYQPRWVQVVQLVTSHTVGAPVLLQVDLEKTKRITGIITQGAKDFGVMQFVSMFKVAYSVDGQTWSMVKQQNAFNDKVRYLMVPNEA